MQFRIVVKLLSAWVCVISMLMSGSTLAASPEGAKIIAYDHVIEKLKQAKPDLNISSVSPTPAPNVLKVEIDGRGVVYVIENGDFFFVGDMYQVMPQGIVSITDQEKSDERRAIFTNKNQNPIVFSPKGEVKAKIAVFTDVDCGYCQKLHREIPELNKLGIEVQYLAYPRAGIGSNSYKKVVSAWCAKKPSAAMDKLKLRQSIPEILCKDHPVDEHFALGGRVGVRGTPAIVLEDGRLMPGYLPAKELASRLGI